MSMRIALLALLLFLAPPAAAQDRGTLAGWQRGLRDPSADVRARAARALAAFDRHAVPALVGALGDGEYTVRTSAAEALVKIGPGAVVPGVIEALGHTESRVRANAAVVLGSFGPAAMPAVPALTRALKDTNPRVRELASEALHRIASAGSTPNASFLMRCH
jgi:HEAT repeat protein